MALCAIACASQLELQVTLAQDTFLPYEPIVARVAVVNRGNVDASIPRVTGGMLGEVFLCSFTSSDQQEFHAPYWRGGSSHCWGERTLAPGESICVTGDIGWHAGRRDPESKGAGACFPPGDYRLRIGWNTDVLGNRSPFADDSSDAVSFTVGKPDEDELAALAIYRDIVYFQWHYVSSLKEAGERIKERRDMVVSLCEKLIKTCPAMSYVLLAKEALLEYYSRSRYEPWLSVTAPAERRAWRDSTRKFYRDVMTSYPKSPIAADFLRRNSGRSYLQEIDGVDANTALLKDLAQSYPESPIGREASRQLRSISAGLTPSRDDQE